MVEIVHDELVVSHDSFFKKSLEQPKVAQDFFCAYLPDELLQQIDISSLRIEKGSFLDVHGKALYTDMLFSVRFAQETSYLYLVAEHQSTPDKNMPLRMLEYVLKIARQYRDPKTTKLPLVFPVVYYHGKQSPYPYSCDIHQQFSYPELAQKYLFKPFHLIDMTAVPDSKILQHQHAAVMEMLQKYVFSRDIMPVIDLLLKNNLLNSFENSCDGDYLEIVLNYVYYQSDSQRTEEITQKLIDALPKVEERVMTIAQRIAAKSKLEGMQQGMQQGMLEGRKAAVMDVARNLLASGVAKDIVIKTTNLTESELALLEN